MGAHHHPDDTDGLIATARARLEQVGEQWTPMRAQLFGHLARHDRPASAYDIAAAVSADAGRRIAPNSIYRILDLFVGADLVRRVESANAFVVNRHPGCAHDCIFLICDTCGKAAHLDDDPLSDALRRAATRAGYTALRPVLEVRGTCAACTGQ